MAGSPYKRRGGSGEDAYATLEGIQRAYLHQQEQWQQSMTNTISGVNNIACNGQSGGPSQGPSSHHMVHHPSLHAPRTAKSLLHEAESMESLLSAHSQQQQQMAHAQVCIRASTLNHNGHRWSTLLVLYTETSDGVHRRTRNSWAQWIHWNLRVYMCMNVQIYYLTTEYSVIILDV